MNGAECFRVGKLNEAIQAAGDELRQTPTDSKLRTFLFELLCFAGEYERAEKQLEVLSGESRSSQLGTLFYRSAVHAEKSRREFFTEKQYLTEPREHDHLMSGNLNGKPFRFLQDADPRVGPRLEVYVAGTYLWMPFRHISSIDVNPPRRVRDLLWIPALIRAAEGFQSKEMGEVLIPALCPLSCQHNDDEVRLGHMTVWETDEDGTEIPYGQKILMADGDEIPLLEVRKLEFIPAASAAS